MCAAESGCRGEDFSTGILRVREDTVQFDEGGAGVDEEGDIGLLEYVVDRDGEAKEGVVCEQEANAAAEDEVVDDLRTLLECSFFCLAANGGDSKVPPLRGPVHVRTCTRPA